MAFSFDVVDATRAHGAASSCEAALMRRSLIVVFVLLLAACSSSGNKASAPSTLAPPTTKPGPAKTGHVFVINLENKSYQETWGKNSPAPYLTTTLRAKGKLLTHYYGVGHASLDNYIAEISGQSPNPQTQADCVKYTEFKGNSGCVYPSSVQTIANQLDGARKTWKTYQEDMTTPCRHPEIGALDTTLVARKGDQYATRHNPFVYFHSIIDSPECQENVVDLKELDHDLLNAASTPNLVFITPNLCHDGHDAPCVDGEPGGLKSADQFLAQLVPKIMASPAYQADGMLVITFDEAEINDGSACCGETGRGGGRVGALVLSSRVKPNTSDATPYNHYALLCSVEDVFSLPHLANANAKGLKCFGKDVYDAS
jgi:hypothetical protein